MSNEKLTGWFDGTVAPVRSGVYEVDQPMNAGARVFRYYDVVRNRWYAWRFSVDGASVETLPSWPGFGLYSRWRGVEK